MVVWCGVFDGLICLHLDQKRPCAYLLLTAYAHVRTEPQSDIGHRGKKKKLVRELASSGDPPKGKGRRQKKGPSSPLRAFCSLPSRRSGPLNHQSPAFKPPFKPSKGFVFCLFWLFCYYGIVTAVDYVQVPYQFTFCALTMAGLCAPIRFCVLCDMQLNVQNDQAKASWRWTEKKIKPSKGTVKFRLRILPARISFVNWFKKI